MKKHPAHTFHIPVMGLAFTIDSPIKVAQYGISSVISIIEDTLMEKMRGFYYGQRNEVYKPIPKTEEDYRVKRITDYLNLVNKIVQEKFEKLKNSTFETGSDLVLYFEMLPNTSVLKQAYLKMLETRDGKTKESLQNFLRGEIMPGSIDVNIMTKVDKNNPDKDGNIPEDSSDAVTALRAFAKSDLEGASVVFSAGLNPRLYNYLEKLSAFTTFKKGDYEKKIIIKVSDYRSAIIQGKYLAKKGLWVSEFRIESGLNCGGHAFATEGYLLGPILEEFKNTRESMYKELFDMYKQALTTKGKELPTEAPEQRITVQGGIGTAAEDRLLMDYYGMDGTGWGSPFLLVPEATTVDEATLQRLCDAKSEDIVLSHSSPLGVRFNYLKGNSGEVERLARINSNKPGSPCTEKFLALNSKFDGKPLCAASVSFQHKQLAELKSQNLPNAEFEKQRDDLYAKECLCLGLSNAAILNYKLEPFIGNSLSVTVCPGPNLAYFNKKASLKEMIDHIYGRANLLTNEYRPHFFVKELSLYVDYLKEQFNESVDKLCDKSQKYYKNFCDNLLNGINYYNGLIDNKVLPSPTEKDTMKKELSDSEKEILTIKNHLELEVLGDKSESKSQKGASRF